ncbi:MAG: 16S rRNA (adenine(1518)-N(6)/adenine(1519)-N(6))-dimethyltransferase RsmA [Sandaracinus sp.]
MSEPMLEGWEDPRKALARHGLRPKKAFSQNFLVARSVVEAIADAAVPAAGARVVELGPGVGTLTRALLARGARVTAVERDRDMIAVLAADFAAQPLQVIEADAAQIDLSALAEEGGPYALAGNLPYAATGAILTNLGKHRRALTHAVLMIQKEVRDRLLASPGTKEWGMPSVFVQAAFEVRPVLRVPAGAFHPAPKVDSAVVRLVPRAVPRAEETPAFVRVVHAGFGMRRKTLRNALTREIDAARVDAALAATGIDGMRRAETLAIEELAALAAAIGD